MSGPDITVVHGHPTDEDIAALTAVLAALAARPEPRPPVEVPTTGAWADGAHTTWGRSRAGPGVRPW